MQPLALSEIEFIDRPGDGRGHRGTQGLFHRPQRLFLVPGFDQDQARGIKAETIKAVPMRPAATDEFSRRKNKQNRPGRHATEDGSGETEGRGHVFVGLGRDLVQRSVNKAASRQMRIKRRQAKGKDRRADRNALQSWQQPAQFIHGLGAASIAIKAGEGGGIRGHGTLKRLDGEGFMTIEQNKNTSKG